MTQPNNVEREIDKIEVHYTYYELGDPVELKIKLDEPAKQAVSALIEQAVNRGEIDHGIDVRYERDVLVAFDKFIKKWCGENYAHLGDSDENDGEFMRQKIEQAVNTGQSIELPALPYFQIICTGDKDEEWRSHIYDTKNLPATLKASNGGEDSDG